MLDKNHIRVLIVDDSVLFREALSEMLRSKPDIEVVGTAGDAYEASGKIGELHPDVITLDFEMPKMNGIEFLKRLIPQYPIPVIIVSSMAINVFEALEAGAIDFIKKPVINGKQDVSVFSHELYRKIQAASEAKIVGRSKNDVSKKIVIAEPNKSNNSLAVIALGASTGGPDALQMVLEELPANCPPVLVTQHMPIGFTKLFADRMNRLCKISVFEAEDKMRLSEGMCVIAAGDRHLRLCRDGRGYFVTSSAGEKVSGHCPSVDVMFNSVAEVAKGDAVGALLTGMGSDGAKGLLAMKKAGAYTIGQDEKSCIVYGMPMVAYNMGAVCIQSPLDKIAALIMKKINE